MSEATWRLSRLHDLSTFVTFALGAIGLWFAGNGYAEYAARWIQEERKNVRAEAEKTINGRARRDG